MMALQSNLSPSSTMPQTKMHMPISSGPAKQSQQQQQQQQQQQRPFSSNPGTPANPMNNSLMANANWMCSLSPGVQPLFRGDYAGSPGSPVQFNTYQVVPGFTPQMQAHLPVSFAGVQEQTLGKKPPYSFPCLIGLALRSAPTGRMSVSQIYDHITAAFPYFRTAKAGWKNSVRHNLSLNKIFCKLERLESEAGKGAMWGIAPNMKEQLERDITQCKQRYPQKIAEAMKEPDVPAPGSAAAQQQQQSVQLQMIGTNAQGQIIFGTAPSPGRAQQMGQQQQGSGGGHQHQLSNLGRASSAPSMPMVMMAQPGNYGNGMSFSSPPKQSFNFNPQSQTFGGAPSSQQVSEDTPQTQAGVMAPTRRLSLPEGMDQVFDSDFTITDLIQTGVGVDSHNSNSNESQQTTPHRFASPTKILGGYEDHMEDHGMGVNDFVPALYDNSALLTDGSDGFSLNSLNALNGYDDDHMKLALGGLVDGPSVKMEMDALQA